MIINLETVKPLPDDPCIEISLSLSEIKFLYKITGLGIKRLWSKEDEKISDGLHEFFKELIDEP